MASLQKKSHSSQRKARSLSDTDLARAAAASADQRRDILVNATEGTAYQRYKGIRDNLGKGCTILSLNIT